MPLSSNPNDDVLIQVAGLLTPPAAAFLRERILSPLHLDLLVLLHQEGSRWWTASSLGAALRTRTPLVVPTLEDLAAFNLLEVRIGSDVLYRYLPWDDSARRAVEEIARLCRTHRTIVMSAVASGRRPPRLPT